MAYRSDPTLRNDGRAVVGAALGDRSGRLLCAKNIQSLQWESRNVIQLSIFLAFDPQTCVDYKCE